MKLLDSILRCLCGTSSSHLPARPALRFRPSLDELEPRLVPSGVDLGSAASYAVLGLQSTQINNSNVTITGNEGVSQGGKLTNMAPSTITGNVTEYQAGQYSGPGKLGGTVLVNPTQITQADSDAANASAAAAALSPTQVFGSISAPTTITGNGSLNVIQINGNITSSLILDGTANDVFVINVTGNVSLVGSTALGLAGGVTASNVLYNFTGASGDIATHVGNVLNGTLLAPTYSFNLDGTFNGEIIGGGQNINLLSGAHVNQVAFTGNTSPGDSLSGSVLNEATSAGMNKVLITLTGTTSTGQVTLTAYTDSSGSFSFTGLAPGTYTITETPPSFFGVPYVNDYGSNTVGSAGTSTGNDVFTGVVLGIGTNGTGYIFENTLSGA